MEFSEEDRALLRAEGFSLEKHPNTEEFAHKKGKNEGSSLVICLNDNGTISAGYDSGDSTEPNIKRCSTVKEALEYLQGF